MTTDERAEESGEHDAPAGAAVEEQHDATAVDSDRDDPDRDHDGPAAAAEDGDDHVDEDEDEDGASPSWWHRDHPVFTPLSGFFTGLATAVVVPGAYAAVLSQLFETHTAEDLFPFVAVLLVVPLALIAFPRTRRFGRYMLAGMLLTAAVVVAVSALTLWILVTLDS